MNKKAILGSAIICGALTALSAAPASASPMTTKLYGRYSTPTVTYGCVNNAGTPTSNCDSSTNGQKKSIYYGDNKPTVVTSGYLNPSGFTDTLTYGAKAGGAGQFQTTLFSVDPMACLKGSGGSCSNTSNSGIEKATIGTSFTFSTSSGGPGITISDTALATFNYSNETDNLCWNDSGVSFTTNVSGASIVEHKSVGTCYAPGSGNHTNDGFEEIIFQLAGNYFEVNLYDWNDWNETPQITFAWLDPTTVPEPASVTVLGAGLLGFGAFMRRRKKAA